MNDKLTPEEIEAQKISDRNEERRLEIIAANEAEEQKVIVELAERKAAHEEGKWNAYKLEQEQRAAHLSGQPVPLTLEEAGLT